MMLSNLTKRAASIALAATAAIGLAMPALFTSQSALSPSAKAYSAEYGGDLGRQICSNGGTVAVTIEAVQTDVKAEIFFTRDVYSKELITLGSNLESREVKLDTSKDEELIFGIKTEKATFYTGDDTRNPDGLPHARVELLAQEKAVTAIVSFEAQPFYKEDALFKDARLKVTGNLAECLKAVSVFVDIKPTSCPNPLSIDKNGVIPIAIVGTNKSDGGGEVSLTAAAFEGFDVAAIDPASVRLAGVAPLRSAIEDVATPYSLSNEKLDRLDCTTQGSDGVVDLALKFNSREVVKNIETFLKRPLIDGEVFRLPVTGNLSQQFGGLPFKGKDVIWVVD